MFEEKLNHHENESIDDWIVDESLIEEIWPKVN